MNTDKKNDETRLVFSSFDGGGPEYRVTTGADIVSWKSTRHYHNRDHENMCGSGYDVIFTFTGIAEGETEMTVAQRSPIAENIDHIYSVKVDADLNVHIKKIKSSEQDF